VKLVILPLALGELQDAAAFYSASANAELGLAFMADVDQAIRRILANPYVGAVFRGLRRRYVLRRFPYSIFYQITPDEIRVVAVAHQRRRPSYWAGRR
jgi:plasmid stabilization system protein ParE